MVPSISAIAGSLLLVAAAALAARSFSAWSGARTADRDRMDARLAAFRARVSEPLTRSRALRRTERGRWAGWRDLVVARIVEEGADARSFHLVARDGKPLAPFEPGQFLTFRLYPKGHEGAVVRCYSLSGDPEDLSTYRVSVKRLRGRDGAPDGLGSSCFHGLGEGAVVAAKAPSGHFFMDRESRRPVVLIGGGIGLTPVLSMAKSIAARPADERPETTFLVALRSRSQALFTEELLALREAGIQVIRCHSQPEVDEIPGTDHERAERVSIDLLRRVLPDGDRRFHLCGPSAMMGDLVAGLGDWGVREDDILYEAFGPATVKTAAAAPMEGEDAGAGAEVIFARSDKAATWTGPAAGSLLDLAEAQGIALEAGCRAGNCGTCATALVEGEVTYLSPPGEDPEEGHCLPCVCIPKGRVVLQA